MSDDENNHEPTDTRMRFDELALSQPILKAVQKAGYENPSPIQERAISAIAEDRTLLAWPRLEPERPRLLHFPSCQGWMNQLKVLKFLSSPQPGSLPCKWLKQSKALLKTFPN